MFMFLLLFDAVIWHRVLPRVFLTIYSGLSLILLVLLGLRLCGLWATFSIFLYRTKLGKWRNHFSVQSFFPLKDPMDHSS
jgi:hypothetical protein